MPSRKVHISSAIVVTRPEKTESVASAVAALDGVDVHAAEAGKIVAVLEGGSSGELGDLLIRISAMNDVVAANMVFEQMLEEQEDSDDDRTHAA